MYDIPVTITRNEEIAPCCFRLVLSGRLHDFHIRPGQFVMLKAGTGYDPLLRRPFAAFRGEQDGSVFLEIYYQVVGRGTELLQTLLPGASLGILGPLGNGFQIPPSMKHAVLVAGGMGIVPIRCLIHTLTNIESTKITLLYGARTAAQLLFLKEFEKLAVAVELSTDDGSSGRHGLVTEMAAPFLNGLNENSNETVCYACGPWPMLRAMAGIAAPLGLTCQVSLETRMACGIGACLGCVVKQRTAHGEGGPVFTRVCLEGPVFEAQEIAW